jgi:chromosome partitioning protein
MASVESTLNKMETYLDVGHRLTSSIQELSREKMSPRRFKGEELRELVKVSSLSTLYMAEKEGRLPGPDLDHNNRRIGATLPQVLQMQEYFGTQPWRAEIEEPVVLSFTNFKGGCWKTTTSWYAGAYYANMGFRVLFVDLDPQASLTLNCGLLPDFETSHRQSLGPFILEEEGYPVESTGSVVRKTYLENMDLIPSTLELAGVEYSLANAVVDARHRGDAEGMFACFQRVRDAISVIKDDYDIIILDGTPSLGLLPLNIIFSSDAVIVPVPTEITDFCSTLSFCDLYREQAETLGSFFGDALQMPEMVFLPTRFSPSEKTATLGSEFVLNQIRETFGASCMKSVIKKHESVVSNLSLLRRTVFDINAGDGGVSREARKKAILNFSSVFDEVLERLVYPRWPSHKALLEDKGIY